MPYKSIPCYSLWHHHSFHYPYDFITQYIIIITWNSYSWYQLRVKKKMFIFIYAIIYPFFEILSFILLSFCVHKFPTPSIIYFNISFRSGLQVTNSLRFYFFWEILISLFKFWQCHCINNSMLVFIVSLQPFKYFTPCYCYYYYFIYLFVCLYSFWWEVLCNS